MPITNAEPPLPWPEQLRPGDELRLRVVDAMQAALEPRSTYLQTRHGHGAQVVLLGYVRPVAPVEVGTLVERHATGSRGRVRGLTGRWAWVEWTGHTADAPTTVSVEHLTVVDESEALAHGAAPAGGEGSK